MDSYTFLCLFLILQLFQIRKSLVLAQNDETKLATDECNTKHNELSSRILFMANCKKAVGVPDSDDVNKEKHECYMMRRYCAMKCVNEGKCPVASLFTLNLNVFENGTYKTVDCSCNLSQYKPGCRNDYSETWANVEKEFTANCTSDGARTTTAGIETKINDDPYKRMMYFTNASTEWSKKKDCFSEGQIKVNCKDVINSLKSKNLKSPFLTSNDNAANGAKWYGITNCQNNCEKCKTESFNVTANGPLYEHSNGSFSILYNCITKAWYGRNVVPGEAQELTAWSNVESAFISNCCTSSNKQEESPTDKDNPYKIIPYFTENSSEWPKVKDCFSDDNIKTDCKTLISSVAVDKLKGPFLSSTNLATNGPKFLGITHCNNYCKKCKSELYFVKSDYIGGKEEAIKHSDANFELTLDCIIESTGQSGAYMVVIQAWHVLETDFIKKCCDLRKSNKLCEQHL